MIADALRAEIELYAAKMRRSNPLFYKAADGTLTPACMTRYLSNVHFLICHTPIYLARAIHRSLQVGDSRLAEHYEHKRGEEQGHDAWADRDIERMSAASVAPAQRDVVPSIRELVAFLATTIDEDPALYLSYILFAEYLIVLLGPEWLCMLEERCGIPRSSMTVIGNHIELDREHVEEALDQIDALVGDPRKLPRMRQVILDVLAYFDRFCAEVTGERAHAVWSSPDAERHVSAA
jgi:pyrroloquinoline quinone (PQQ) biosynthesis protein C